jgi:integrase
LYLYVTPTGLKSWRLKYRIDGKERVLTIGKYSANPKTGVSISAARKARDEAKQLLSEGKDPSREKQRKKLQVKKQQADTFELIAREWWEARKPAWTPKHANAVIHSLEHNVFPFLGKRPVADITPQEILHVVRQIEARGAHEIASKVLQRCNGIYRYAITTSRAIQNPAAGLQEALKTPEKRNFAALTASELPEFLGKLEAYSGYQTKLATKLLLLTFVRTGELRGARWEEFDLKKREWSIPASRMKMRRDHLVPLSKQAVSLIKELKQINGHRDYLFPSRQSANKPMSENTILFAIYKLGYHSKATGHGFRTTASTILNEQGFNPDAIERQLAHVPHNKIRGAYNKAEYLPERKKMMQWWAEYLDEQQKASK